jgi:hypothetical protein
MTQYYDKTTQELMIEYFNNMKENNIEIFKKPEIVGWFNKNYPKIKNNTIQCHLIKLSVNAPSRKHYKAHEDGRDDFLFQVNGNTFKLYDKTKDVIPIIPTTITEESDENGSKEFAYEKDLQNFLVKNLTLIEPGLKLYEEDGINGIEYPIDGRYIDILALDRNDNYVIIELKVSKGYDRVVGQLLRYKNWIKKNQAENGQNVRGIIICKEITDDLILACMDLKDIELFEYELSIKLHKKEV